MNIFFNKIHFYRIRKNTEAILILRFLLIFTLICNITVFNSFASSQPRIITGQITDLATGESLPGVNIVIEGTTTGVITDMNGNFSIQVPNEEVILLISYVGFNTQRIPVKGKTIINIELEQDITALDEVVVIGYGAQKKPSVVGSIAVVSDEDLVRRSGLYNLAQAISGQIGGVTVMERTGEPGAEDPQILIRGMSTWNNAQPLILVDGLERRMSDIDISEVATISVLKDASATAVFGVKGANGVILITTKRGELGKPALTFTANTGFKNISRISKVMEAYSAQSYRNTAVKHEISTNEASWQYFIPQEIMDRYKKPQEDPYTYLYPNIDWEKVMFKNWAPNSRFNLNLRGGTDFAKYFASLGYATEGDLLKSEYNERRGYQPGFSYDRINFRGNLDFNLTKSTILSTNLSGFLGSRKGTGSDFTASVMDQVYSYAHVWRGVFELAPDAFPVMYPDGNYGKDPANINLNNPVAIVQEGGVKVTNRRQVSTDIKLLQKLDFITPGLSVSANISYDTYAVSMGPSISDGGNRSQAIYTYMDPRIIDATTKQDSLNYIFYFSGSGPLEEDYVVKPWVYYSEAVSAGNLERVLFYQASAQYSQSFGKHDISGLFLFNRRQNATGGEFANFREDWVGRATYAFDNKYFAEFNGAYNGSEKFNTDYRFGFFPSMALGWMISNESFMEQFDWLSKFKLRASIGQVGSDAGIPRWGYVSSWKYISSGVSSTSYFFNQNGLNVPSPYKVYMEGTIANPNIRWETAIKRNIGAEFAFLGRVITFDIDLFKDSRKDIFMTANRRNIPNTFGAPAVPANLGKTETKGYEMELGINKTWTNGFGFWIKTGMNRATDIVLESEDPKLLPAYQKVAGFPIGQHRTQIREGFINNWDDVFASVPATSNNHYKMPGDWFINDFNGDGIINEYDAAPYGYPVRPQNSYSTALGFNYKNFGFMMQFFGVTNIILSPPYVNPTLTRWVPVSERLDNYWRPDNINADYRAPRLATSSPAGDWNSVDGSYLRLKTLEISYNLPTNFIKTIGLTNTRIYVTGNNLFYWSKMPVDFETGSFDLNRGYPTYKMINFGLDISF